jgi:hypothetical protein
MSSAAKPVSMYQYGTGQRDSSRSVQPLSGCAYRSRYTSLDAIGTITSGARLSAAISARGSPVKARTILRRFITSLNSTSQA